MSVYLRNYLFVIFLFSFFSTSAQETPKSTFIKVDYSRTDWFQETLKENPNYFKVKALYDAFFEAHPYEKSIQKSFLRRWFQLNINNINAEGVVQNSTVSAEESAKFIKANQVNKAK